MKDPKQIRSQIANLRLTARRLIHSFGEGSFRTLFHGRGIEFATLREYVPGDDIRQIEWNTTARRGTPYVKTFVEERDLTIMLAIDMSSSMEIKLDTLAQIVALIAYLAQAHEDRIGCLGFTDKVEFFVPAQKDRRQPERILHLLLNKAGSPRKTSISEALGFLRQVLKKKSILFVLSDFLDRNYETHLLALAARHEIVGIYLYDLLESSLIANRVFDSYDPESGKRILIDTYDDQNRKNYTDLFRAQKSSVLQSFAKSQSDLFITPTGKAAVNRFMQFLRARQNSRAPLQIVSNPA